MAEERLVEIQEFALRFQRQLEAIKDGFTVEHNGSEYDFIVDFVDRLSTNFGVPIYSHSCFFRNDKKVSQALLGVTYGCLSCEV